MVAILTRGCVPLAHGLLSTFQIRQGLETYKYILHPALTRLVTPTTCLMMLSMNHLMIKVLYLSRGEQSYRCGIIEYNVLSNKTPEPKVPTTTEPAGGNANQELLQADKRLDC